MRRLIFLMFLGLCACSDPTQVDDLGTGAADGGRKDADGVADGSAIDGNAIDGGANDDAESRDGESSDGESTDGEPGDGEPGDGEPTDGEPGDGEPGDGEPGDRGPTDGDPLDAQPQDAPGSRDAAAPVDGGFLPNFTQQPIDTNFLHGQAIELVDIEPDGDLDALGSSSLDDTVRLYLNNGDGTAWNRIDVAQPGTIVAMHAMTADLDGDSDLDVAAVGLFDRNVGFASEGEVTWYENSGSPTGTWTRHPITGLTFWGPRYVAVGDLTGDGLPEIAVGALQTFDLNGGEQGHGVRWFRNTGGAFTAPITIDANLLNVEVIRMHDVDGDGVLDLIASGNQSNLLVWYENQRPTGMVQNSPTFVRHTIFSIAGPSGFAFGQRDADAALELIATGDNGAGGLVTELDPPANPSNLWSSSPIDSAFGAGTTVRTVAMDLNLDGRTDVAVSSAGANAVRAYVDDGAGGWIQRIVQDPFTGVDFVNSGDVDGDGIADLVTSTYGHDSNFDRFDWWRVEP